MDHSCRIVRVFLWFISLTCFLLLAAGVVVSAPVPPSYRQVSVPAPSSELVGEWNIHWQGGIGRVTFRRQGGYTCVWFGKRWIGFWRIEDGKLVVTEAIEPTNPNTPPNWYTWSATLEPGKRAGKLATGGSFSLTSTKPAKPAF